MGNTVGVNQKKGRHRVELESPIQSQIKRVRFSEAKRKSAYTSTPKMIDIGKVPSADSSDQKSSKRHGSQPSTVPSQSNPG